MKLTFGWSYSLFLMLLAFNSYGQRSTLKFKGITLDDGLSQSTINCILQDRKGFIWIGTRGGLNRYDGTSFKVFLHNPSDSTSISNNIIYSLYEDKNGLIWVGTQEGLSVFDHATRAFTVFKKSRSPNKGLSHNTVKSIIEDANGNYWLGTNGGGLNKITLKPGPEPIVERAQFTHYWHEADNEQSISSNYLTALVADKNGYLWIGTRDNGLNKFDPKSATALHYLKEQKYSISDNRINTLYLDRQGDIWAGTQEGLSRLREKSRTKGFYKNERIYRYFHQEKRQNSLSNNTVISIVQGASGLIWIGTDGGGLNKFNKRTGVFTHYKNDVNDPNSIKNNNIRCIYDDIVGMLWIGTNAGISQLGSQRKRFKIYQRDGLSDNAISSNYVQALYKERNGITWIGTLDGGLNRLNTRTGKVTQYTTSGIFDSGIKREFKKPEPVKKKRRRRRKKKTEKEKPYVPLKNLSDMRVLAIHRDVRNTLWVGTGGGGLNRLDLRTERFRHYKADLANPDSLSHNTIRVIFEDRRGIIWLGTEGGGLNRFDRRKFKRYVKEPDNPGSLTSSDIRALAQDKNGKLWIGTYGGGLNVFNPKTEKFTAFVKQKDQQNGLSSNIIFCLHFDKSGILWIGTSEGLNKYDIEKNEFTHYTMNDGLPNNLIYGILHDGKGNLWLSTNKGLSRFNIETGKFNNYDRKDGLQSNEFIPGAYSMSKNGEMLFGGINGYNSFFPASVKDNQHVPQVVITDFKLFNKPVTFRTPESPLSKDISETTEITLSHEHAVFSFDFVALNFANAEKNQYAYKMENFDPDWNYVGNRTYAKYTNLAPGEYIFRVKASNNDGIWNEEGTAIKIKILPPLWETWWFKVLAFVLFIFLGFLLYKIRVKRIEYKKEMLEKEVALRTAQVVSQRDELEKKKKALEKKKKEIEKQNYLLGEKTEEILAQRNNIEEKNKQLEKAWDEVLKANNELKMVNVNLEEKVEERTVKLRDAIKELMKSNQELDTFLYRASHDLKGPITRLLGLTQLAKLDNKKSKDIDYINIIELSSIDMNKTLNKLINIHSINTKPVNNEIVDIHALFDQIMKPYKSQIEESKIKIELNFDKSSSFVCDESLLKIIIENLLENAITFKGTVKPRVIISLASNDKKIVMKMEDNGLGIDNEYKSKIFQMFFRGSEISQGNGLGLYLVKKAIDKLEGKIEVDSEEGKFTSFSVSIPKRKAQPKVPAHIV
ncbi:two-component regulator propeller domain-containing protein [Fulvivirgaceae bacterium BMA12]|uniref:histidine kinase n=1 Tax=Agaribacillus aureus TaxID=3051825 RepID=A0ABT8L9W9_9BACT|nr:two-component regulator propeller domain-containing protein [Fulvivirgaceae bacterium BMA12]